MPGKGNPARKAIVNYCLACYGKGEKLGRETRRGSDKCFSRSVGD